MMDVNDATKASPFEVHRRHRRAMRNRALLLAALLGVCPWGKAGAQSYTIDWFKVSGGGGTAAGNGFALSGTIGQPEAGAPMAGGNYSIVGGFWSPVAVVQTPGAPALKIFLTATNTVLIFWPWPSTGWALQQNAALGTANWTAPPETTTHDSNNNFILANSPKDHRVFRLTAKP